MSLYHADTHSLLSRLIQISNVSVDWRSMYAMQDAIELKCEARGIEPWFFRDGPGRNPK